MIGKLFKKEKLYEVKSASTSARFNVLPKDVFTQCKNCGEIIYKKDLEVNAFECPKCDYLFRITPRERLEKLLDRESFNELFNEIESLNPIDFKGYEEKINKYQKKSNEKSAIVTGIGEINRYKVALAVMNPFFMMGSMGSALGEKLTRIIEKATFEKIPLLIFTASGGARMQEGVFSLMQMAKTSAALKKHSNGGNLFVSILTDPTTGGVSASFAMLGDIIIAEPKALIGFAGPRVIRQTIKQELLEGFQSSEYLLDHGFVDIIVRRDRLRETLKNIFKMHKVGIYES